MISIAKNLRRLCWLGLLIPSVVFAQNFGTLALQNQSPPATGSNCNFDFLEAAEHAYVFVDSTWPSGDTDIPDECALGGRSCTPQDLEDSQSITGASDTSTSGVPAGTGTGKLKVQFSESADQGRTNATGIMRSAANGDFTACGWFNFTSDTDANFAGVQSLAADSLIFRVDCAGTPEGSLEMESEGQGAQLITGNDVITCTAGDWAHICYSVDNDGSSGGTDTRTIWVNGNSEATDSGPENGSNGVSGGSMIGLKDGAGNPLYEAHEFLIFHDEVLDQTDICNLMLCGADDSANAATRDSTFDTSGNCTVP